MLRDTSAIMNDEKYVTKKTAMYLDVFLDILQSKFSQLMIFSTTENLDFGYGFVTINPLGLGVVEGYTLQEFEDSYSDLAFRLSIARVIGKGPSLISFDSNKSAIVPENESINSIRDYKLLESLIKKSKMDLIVKKETAKCLIDAMEQGENRSENTSVENEFHARKTDIPSKHLTRARKSYDILNSYK